MGAVPAGQGSPQKGDREAAVGATILSDRSVSEGEAKWWDPAVLHAPVARPSEWENVSQAPSPPESLNNVRRGAVWSGQRPSEPDQ